MIPGSRIKRIHFVGIGGAGMSGIAEVLHTHGFSVSGSDQSDSPKLEQMRSMGIKINIGHLPEHAEGCDVLVYSSAVKQDNPELERARKLNIPIIRRAEMLGELMRLKYTLAIAGTHGKTTTTSLVGHIWNTAELSPTIIVGGIVKNMGTGAQTGTGDALIAEADEYDKSFLQMVPTLALITNVDNDHLDCYGSFDEIKQAFISFANKIPFYGQVFMCVDEYGVKEILPSIHKPMITYGLSRQADYRAENVEYADGRSSYDVYRKGEKLGRIITPLSGLHNVKNSLGALAMALEEGITWETVQKAFHSFGGVERRFEKIAEAGGVLYYDDYAHHPVEVEATLRAARDAYPSRRIVAVFQPHLYSRTKDHAVAFGSAFMNCDIMVLCPVYGARETPIEGVSSQLIADAALKMGHRGIMQAESVDHVPSMMRSVVKPDDLVVCMGAGSIWKLRQVWNSLESGNKK